MLYIFSLLNEELKNPQNPQNHRVDEAFCPPKGCPFAKVSLALVDPITDEVEIVCECAWSVGLVTEVEKFNRIRGHSQMSLLEEVFSNLVCLMMVNDGW